MLGRACQAAFLVALFVLSTGLGVVESSILHDQTPAEQRTQGVNGVVDVPTYRVGDKWVYETKFDVAQLLVQANVSASLNTLTGDTVNEVTDIFYETDTNGDTVLAYEIEISGSFTSGNSGATLEGVTGRLNIDYDGIDILRARDLATITSDFTLDVRFRPFNLGIFEQTLGIVTFDNTYTPAKERYDFPIRNGDQWWMEFEAKTEVSGTSDYFDPTEFDSKKMKTIHGRSSRTRHPQKMETHHNTLDAMIRTRLLNGTLLASTSASTGIALQSVEAHGTASSTPLDSP